MVSMWDLGKNNVVQDTYRLSSKNPQDMKVVIQKSANSVLFDTYFPLGIYFSLFIFKWFCPLGWLRGNMQ